MHSLKLLIDTVMHLALVAGASPVLPDRNAQKVIGQTGQKVSAPDAEGVRDGLIRAEIIPTVIDDFHPAFLLTAEWSPKTQADLGNMLPPSKLQDAPTLTLTPTETTLLASPPPPPASSSSEEGDDDDGSSSSSSAAANNRCAQAQAFDTSNVTYAVVLTDPDAPSRHDPKWSEFCHWIATGHVAVTPKPPPLPSSVAAASNPSSSCSGVGVRLVLDNLKEVVSYKPPGPPEKTGPHRYVFLTFAPVNATTAPLHLSRPSERKRWGRDKAEGGGGVREWARENGLTPVAANFIYAQNEKQ